MKLRESLPFAGKPWKSPAPMPAAARPTNSFVASTSSRSRAASACPVATVPAKASSATLAAGASKEIESLTETRGMLGIGMPDGI
jgi:hypothetical protein